MFDVITKTLPLTEAELAAREAIAEGEETLMHQAASLQNNRMIGNDLTRGATKPAPAAEDPLAAVRDAIQHLRDEMFECALDEVQNTGRRDPDYARADVAEEALLDEVKRLLLADRMAFIASVQKPTKPPAAPDNGLLTSHNPDRRGAL